MNVLAQEDSDKWEIVALTSMSVWNNKAYALDLVLVKILMVVSNVSVHEDTN